MKREFARLSLLKPFERPALILLGAGILTLILMNLEFSMLEANLYDLRMAKGPQLKPSQDIVLVSLDNATTKALDEFAPLPLDVHARFMEALEEMQPKAVGYLVDMNRVTQMNPDPRQEEWAKRFVNSAGRIESRGIPILLGTAFDVTGEVLPPYPLSALPHSIAIIHKDGNVFAEDKITRRALTYLYEKPVFHMELAQKLKLVREGFRPQGSYYVPEVDGQYFFFRYHGSTVLDPAHPGALPYQSISFIDILMRSPKAAEAVKDKILLVGTSTKEDSGDFAFTPYSKTPYVNPKLVVHANILDSVIHNQGIARAPTWFNWFVTFVVSAFVFWWVMNSKPLYGVFATLGLAFGFIVVGQVLFSFRGLWIRESQPLIGIFLGYYLVVPYRLIREYKKRWDYQQKNEVLIQVEELKTNFLSLVTHDLKTPVARIQGLAETLMRKAADRLIEFDKDALNNIIASTDELNRFITSILELTKVESNRLQLRLESKDVNQLVEKCVESLATQARCKNIQIRSELEPLFPIKLDASLISKVIGNLIDNALKYSPEDSEIVIQTREVDNWIEISVQDRGIGMSSEEKQSLFTRFYRAKNDTTARVGGTGLGLYLTKYFVEAHHGRVEIQSEPGQGSTFKIVLPIDGPEPVLPGLSRPKRRDSKKPGITIQEKEMSHV